MVYIMLVKYSYNRSVSVMPTVWSSSLSAPTSNLRLWIMACISMTTAQAQAYGQYAVLKSLVSLNFFETFNSFHLSFLKFLVYQNPWSYFLGGI